MPGKVCLIIGGGHGMGAATARDTHMRGCRLALMSPSESCGARWRPIRGAWPGGDGPGNRPGRRLSFCRRTAAASPARACASTAA